MKRAYRLTQRAYADLKGIARYTRQQWGEAQRERYLRALDDRFAWLAEHPNSGKHRQDVCELEWSSVHPPPRDVARERLVQNLGQGD